MAEFVVTTAADSGAGSLRQAILDANAAGGADTISFAPALSGATITLAAALPRIAGDVVIDGSGAEGLTISGGDLYRVFWAHSGNIVIEDLKIADGFAKGGAGGNGFAGGGGGAGLGGGIFIDKNAHVTLREIEFADNVAQGGAGGVGNFWAGVEGGGGGGFSDAGGAYGGGPARGHPGYRYTRATDGGDYSGGGGGAAQYFSDPRGGHGGFGGGGGGSGGSGDYYYGEGGNGGFGGGAGAAGGWEGLPGYGGGEALDHERGGGGAGLGGGVFVREGGSVTLEDVTFTAGNRVVGGDGADPDPYSYFDGGDGKAEGSAVFVMGGGPLAYSVGAGRTIVADGSFHSNVGVDLIKGGSGTLVLNYATYMNGITVADGVLRIDTQLYGQASITVQQGSTLSGTGSLGAVTVQSGGTLAPGGSTPGAMATGDLSLAPGATLAYELGAYADRLDVYGTVSLDGADLNILTVGGFSPVAGTMFLLISNDESDAVSGAFAGFADDVSVIIGGLRYTVDYQSGDGNDVVLSIRELNRAPHVATGAAPQQALAGESFSYSLQGVFGDVDGDALTLTATLQNGDPLPSWLGFDGSTFTGTPSGAEDLLSIKLTATDASGRSASTSFDLTVGRILNGGKGDQVLTGGLGGDVMSGGQGSDTLYGAGGRDVLRGDQGDDRLFGGEGADLFVFGKSGGADRIKDFELGVDHLRLESGIGIKSIAAVGGDTLIHLTNGGGTIMLEHVVGLSLSDASQIFA